MLFDLNYMEHAVYNECMLFDLNFMEHIAYDAWFLWKPASLPAITSGNSPLKKTLPFTCIGKSLCVSQCVARFINLLLWLIYVAMFLGTCKKSFYYKCCKISMTLFDTCCIISYASQHLTNTR